MILTGSAEFFPDTGKDRDYLVFRDQPYVFMYEHAPGRQCHFCYREDLTKREYFGWHRTENTWSLNFAPLITRGFLERLDIDIHGADYDDVYWIVKLAFSTDYWMPLPDQQYPFSPIKYPKWLYRIYIYACFIRNGDLTLTDEQHRNAFNLYRQQHYDMGVLRSIYNFFDSDSELAEIGIRRVIPPQEFAHGTESE